MGEFIFGALCIGLFMLWLDRKKMRQASAGPPSLPVPPTQRGWRRAAPASTMPAPAYRRVRSLLTAGEMRFACALGPAIASVTDECYLAMKVRLADLIETTTRGWDGRPDFNRIKAKHIDFVICDKATLAPLIAIELDDRSHRLPKRVARDKFVNEALFGAGLTLLRFEAANGYDRATIARRISAALP